MFRGAGHVYVIQEKTNRPTWNTDRLGLEEPGAAQNRPKQEQSAKNRPKHDVGMLRRVSGGYMRILGGCGLDLKCGGVL